MGVKKFRRETHVANTHICSVSILDEKSYISNLNKDEIEGGGGFLG